MFDSGANADSIASHGQRTRAGSNSSGWFFEPFTAEFSRIWIWLS
jgi:hypothetical protein